MTTAAILWRRLRRSKALFDRLRIETTHQESGKRSMKPVMTRRMKLTARVPC